MNSLTKNLVIGIATLAVTGSAIVASGIYAATSTSGSTQSARMDRGDRTENIVNSLSGKVSAEALTALQTLMAKHKTEMDALKNSSTTVDKTAMQAKREALKTEMDALVAKYPELKTALPQGGKDGGQRGGGKMGGKENIESLLTGVSDTDKASLKAIRDEYQTKHDALRTEEKAKMDVILAKYPEVKAKLDAMEKNRPQKDGQTSTPQAQ